MSQERLLKENQPYPLEIDQAYSPLIKYLAEQSMWEEHFADRQGQKCKLIDFKNKVNFDFNPRIWQADKVEKGGEYEVPEVVDGLVVYVDYEQLDRVGQTVKDFCLYLSQEAPVFIFEEKGLDHPLDLDKRREKREKILEKWGLVERDVLIRPSPRGEAEINNYFVWRSRMSKKWKPREPVNYFDGGPEWREKWLTTILYERIKEYEDQGFSVLSYDEVINKLRATTFPLNDFGRLANGFGFRLEAICGCQWHVDLDGVWERDPCSDPGCDGLPVGFDNPFEPKKRMSWQELSKKKGIVLPRGDYRAGEVISRNNKSYRVVKGELPDGRKKLFGIAVNQ